jgi:hypothetical protein
MHQEVQQVFNFSITLREVIANTLWATLCGVIVSSLYVLAFRGLSYSTNLIKSIVMLTMITAFVLMVVGDNLAKAFIMVGLLSLIRFRTAMDGAQDFMFLFFALAIGLACGEGLYMVALTGCLLIGIVTTAMAQLLAKTQQRDFVLTIVRNAALSNGSDYGPILQSFCRRHKAMSTKGFMKGTSSYTQLAYVVSVNDSSRNEALVDALKAVEGVKQVMLEFEEG